MPQGKIKEYAANRGYGNIVDSGTGQQLTFYANYVTLKQGQVLKAGQDVEYDIESDRHKHLAVNVKIVEKK